MRPLQVAPHHTEANRSEQPEQADRRCVPKYVEGPSEVSSPLPCGPVNAEAEAEDGVVQSWIVMMDVGDTAHCSERRIMQKPADDRVYAGVVELVNFRPGEISIASLPSHEVVE